MTEISNQIIILAELYANYREDKGFQEFVEFNDLGLPLAYLSSEGLAMPSEDGLRYIAETFELFLGSLDIEDTGFTTLDEMLNTIE
jgi:hypothetical protein